MANRCDDRWQIASLTQNTPDAPGPARPVPTYEESGNPTIWDRSNMSDLSREKPRPTERPTSFGADITRIAQNESGVKLIAKLVRELLAQRPYADPATLREDVEQRCQALGLACTRDQVERALELVGSNTQLLAVTRRRPLTTPVSTAPPTITPAEARRFLAKAGADISGGRLRRGNHTSRLVPL